MSPLGEVRAGGGQQIVVTDNVGIAPRIQNLIAGAIAEDEVVLRAHTGIIGYEYPAPCIAIERIVVNEDRVPWEGRIGDQVNATPSVVVNYIITDDHRVR